MPFPPFQAVGEENQVGKKGRGKEEGKGTGKKGKGIEGKGEKKGREKGKGK